MAAREGARRLPESVALRVIPAYEREYGELCDNWKSLEQKAQLAAGAAGAILTGGLAILGNDKVTLPKGLTLLLILSAFLVFLALACSLASLRVSSATLPPAGEDLRKLAWELFDSRPAELESSFSMEAAHLLLVHWDTACRDLHGSIEKKASWVARAQWCLLGAGISTFGLILWKLRS